MVFKAGAMAAAGLSVLGLDSPAQAEGLMRQLQSLGLQAVVQQAMAGDPTPPVASAVKRADPKTAKRVLRDRKNALSRERERQKAVEAALQRLRAEKAMRLKQREALRAKQRRRMQPVRGVVFVSFCFVLFCCVCRNCSHATWCIVPSVLRTSVWNDRSVVRVPACVPARVAACPSPCRVCVVCCVLCVVLPTPSFPFHSIPSRPCIHRQPCMP